MDNSIYRWVPVDINNLPTKDVFIRYGEDEKEHGSGSLILELIENGWLNVEVLVKVEADQQEGAIEEAAVMLFNKHNPYTQIETEVGQKLLNGFRKDVKELSSKYHLIPKQF